MSQRSVADLIRCSMLAFLLTALLGTAGSAVFAQQPAKPASAPARVAETPQASAENPAIKTHALKEAEHRAAIAEAKAELMDAANGRLEIWIGAFGILITVMLALAGFFTWRSAAHAARAEVQDMRDALSAIAAEAKAAKEAIDRLAHDATEKHKGIADISADLLARANAQPGKEDDVPVSEEARLELVEIERQIEAQPDAQWSPVQFRLMLIGAESKKDWHRYVELADQMAFAHGSDAAERAYALFAKARGYEAMEEYAKAAEAYAFYLDECPEDSLENRTSALNNWGSALDEQAKARQKIGDSAESDRLWALAGDKYQAALAIEPDMHQALNNWGCAFDEQAKASQSEGNSTKADQLRALAGEKYQAALVIKPDKYEALVNWSSTLLAQAFADSSPNRYALLDKAEKLLQRANGIKPGSGSYNLACIAGLRGDGAGAARWLCDAKIRDRNCPDCANIQADGDFDRVRETPEFRQALIDIGCGPATVEDEV